MQDLTDRHALDAVLGEPRAVLLKHGAHCPISANARKEVAAFESAYPDTPVYGVEVTGQRELSEYLAERLGVSHESPQAFVLRDGAVEWKATHFDVTARALGDHAAG